MKTKIYLTTGLILKKSLVVLCTISYCLSCAKIQEESVRIDGTQLRETGTVLSDNSVSMEDVMSMIAKDFPQTKGTHIQVEPFIGESSDTLMYIVNNKPSGGWKIYSTDKRTPAVLAEGDSGYFSIEEGSPAVAMWISRVGEDISRVKKAKDEELIFSKEEIGAYKSQWASNTQRVTEKDPSRVVPRGHWEELITSSTIVYDVVDHMVGKWDQGDPYNTCCPYYTSIPDTRALAGCVAIAGSQMLHYLHYKIGRPVYMFSEGYCYGDIDNYYYYSFSNPSSTVWSDMSTSYTSSSNTTIPEAIMIGYVGRTVNMHYCDNIIFGKFSWAVPVNLKTDLFEPMGISCSHGDYDENIVRSSLLNEMPVIVSASNLVVPVDGSIHCFVIDGYRRTQIETIHHFHYVFDEPHTKPVLMPEDYDTYEYSSPTLTSIKINWGWKSQWRQNDPVNDGWYSLTAGWTVTNGGTYDYNHYVKMIYGFALAD